MRRALHFALVLTAVLVAIALGATAVVLGEADDSPGLQGIGVIGATAAALRWRGPGRWRGPDQAAGRRRLRRPERPARCGSGRGASVPR